jgi:hypothetical protein
MSTPRIDPNTSSLPVEGPKPRQAAPSTPFSQVLSGTTLFNGAQNSAAVVAAPVLSAAIREGAGAAAGAAVAGALGGAVGGLNGNAAAAANGVGGQNGEVGQMRAMQAESHAFNLQLLGLQQEVQDENRRFTTVSNCLKAAHDTAKSAVTNLHS